MFLYVHKSSCSSVDTTTNMSLSVCARVFPCKGRYRVILNKVSFGIFRTSLVSKEDKNFTLESKDKGLSLSNFS